MDITQVLRRKNYYQKHSDFDLKLIGRCMNGVHEFFQPSIWKCLIFKDGKKEWREKNQLDCVCEKVNLWKRPLPGRQSINYYEKNTNSTTVQGVSNKIWSWFGGYTSTSISI